MEKFTKFNELYNVNEFYVLQNEISISHKNVTVLDSAVNPTGRRCVYSVYTCRQMANFSTYFNEIYVWVKFRNVNKFWYEGTE